MSSEQEAKAVAAFENSDRIREISLPVTMVYLFWGHLRNKKSFQELEHLVLSESRRFFSPTALPYEFLGGPSPRRLRNILLNGVHLPTLPQLLLSSRDLVSLHLGYYTLTCNGFISPEVLSTSLSATTRLEYLYIDCHPPTPGSYPPNPSPSAPHATPPCTSTSLLPRKSQLTSGNSSPLVVLSALTYFHFGFFIEYMENFVSRIHAPHLQNLDLSCKFSDQGVLNFPQLSQFISRTERLSSLPFRTSISLDSAHSGTKGFFSIDHHFKFLPSPQEVSHMRFRCVDMADWQASKVDHICAQLSPLASSVKQLKISAFYLPPNLKRKTDPAPWLQLLTPYNSVEEVEFCGKDAACTGIASALEQSTWEMAQELLPALRVLRIRGFHTWSISNGLITSFVAARQLAGRPIIIHRLTQKNQDAAWETFENDTHQD